MQPNTQPHQSPTYTRGKPDLTRATLAYFDSLPDAAFVSLPVVCALFSCSRATVWRRVQSGQLIAPHRIGSRTTRWCVKELRDVLARIKATGSVQ